MKNNTNKSLRNVLITFGILSSISFQSNAEGLFDSPSIFDTPSTFNLNTADNSGDNSFYKSDGSLVIIKGAKDSGIIVKGTDDGMEQEYYVVPKDDGSKTFIYDEGLTVCDSTGCY
ncbi:hypothetical protein N9A26_00025 [bacterium]|nr:hypothetical protein [bacterium]